MRRYLSPTERRLRWNRWTRWTLVILLGFLVATLIDPIVQAALPSRTGPHADYYPRLEEKGWYQSLRSVGHWLPWAMLVVAFLLHDHVAMRDRPRPARFDRGLRLLAAPAIAALATEILKVTLRRERPAASEMLYSFKPLGEGVLSSSNVGLPSSHAAVAAAGAALLALALPWSTPVVAFAAIGCAYTRVVIGAHHVSDVFFGLVVGLLSAIWVWRLGRARSSIDILP